MNSGSERVFPLVTISAGDYLLVDNDGRMLWRIRRYDEQFIGEDGLTVEYRPCWGIWRWTRRVESQDTFDALDLDDWDQWEFWDGPLSSRGEALTEVLRTRQ